MRPTWLVVGLCILADAKVGKPHLIYMLADDFGYFDVSWKNPAANTPNMDQLVAEGLELNRFYTYKFCSPTRSSFLSGRLPLHVNEDNNPTSKPGGADVRMSLISQKLKALGYATSTSGKWHGGGYLIGQVPYRKGFDRSLVFLNGNEDHYTRHFGILSGYDFWQDAGNKMDDFGANGTYSNYLYTEHAVQSIEAFDPSKNDALFMYVAFQVTHSPYEVPDVYRNLSIATNGNKQTYFGMATAMDEGIGNITKALKAKGMWDDTLIVFSADNGGEHTAAGNNYPLRGGKYTDFEGGTRNVAFASGGWLPKELRGQSTDELVHICDIWATFSALAGDNEPSRDHGAEAWPEVPAPDSIDVSAIFRTMNAKSGRTEVPLSQTALIVGNHKIVHEKAGGKNFWSGPEWPAYDSNNSKTPKEEGTACSPCIFDIFADPNERNDLSGTDKGKQLQSTLQARLVEIKATAFSTAKANFRGNFTSCTSNDDYKAAHGGFVGPLCTEGPPAPAPPSTGVSIQNAEDHSLCLYPRSSSPKANVVVGLCGTAAANWKLEDRYTNGSFVSWAGHCLRPLPREPANCKDGVQIIIGKCTAQCPGVQLVGKQLQSTGCPGWCIGNSDGKAVLKSCADAASGAWVVPSDAAYLV